MSSTEARWQALRARMDAQAGRRHAARVAESAAAAQARETALRARVDAAITEALGRAQAAPAAPVAEAADPDAAPHAEAAAADAPEQPERWHGLTFEEYQQRAPAAIARLGDGLDSPLWRGQHRGDSPFWRGRDDRGQ